MRRLKKYELAMGGAVVAAVAMAWMNMDLWPSKNEMARAIVELIWTVNCMFWSYTLGNIRGFGEGLTKALRATEEVMRDIKAALKSCGCANCEVHGQ